MPRKTAEEKFLDKFSKILEEKAHEIGLKACDDFAEKKLLPAIADVVATRISPELLDAVRPLTIRIKLLELRVKALEEGWR